MPYRALGLVVALFLLAACDDPSSPDASLVRIVPDSAVVTAGDSVQLRTEPLPVDRWLVIDFSHSDDPVVTADGWVRGRGAGTGSIVAWLGELSDTAGIRVTPGAPVTAAIDWSPHGIQEGVSYETDDLFETAVSDAFGNTTSAELHWASANEEVIRFTDGTMQGIAPGTTSVDVGLTPEQPEDGMLVGVAPFTGTWRDLAVTIFRAPPDFNLGQEVVCALDTGGHASCRGPNDYGQLGYHTPVVWSSLGDGTGRAQGYRRFEIRLPVDTDLRFTSIDNRSTHTCGLAEDGVAYCWGQPEMTGNPEGGVCAYGYMMPDLSCRFEPRPVREDLTFLEITASCGITETGALWCWGEDVWRVFPDTPLRGFDGGEAAGCGLSAEGAAYCWGGNEFGQLGIGSADTLEHPEPEEVATDLGFTDIAYHTVIGSAYHPPHACGIASDGAVHCWGAGGAGQLGTTESLATCPGPPDGEGGPCSPEPVRVASEETFETIEAGQDFTCGLTTGGELYCWGAEYGATPALVPFDQPVTAFDVTPLCMATADEQITCPQ